MSKEASKIKNDRPIMVVIGNPPYSVSSSNKGAWIQNLTKVYKENLNEKNIQPLSDDYIKFIRFSEHFIEKNRNLETGVVTAEKITGKIGKKAIIVDDMISSGKTITVASDLLKKNGAEEIYVFATHPVFSENAPKILQDSMVEKVYVADTIFVPEEKRFPKLEILSVSEMIANSIKSN